MTLYDNTMIQCAYTFFGYSLDAVTSGRTVRQPLFQGQISNCTELNQTTQDICIC